MPFLGLPLLWPPTLLVTICLLMEVSPLLKATALRKRCSCVPEATSTSWWKQEALVGPSVLLVLLT